MPEDKSLDPELPKKLYFKIGEVSELTNIPAHVLRFWETAFSGIRPKRTSSGQRMYRRSDVRLIFKIKYLLYEKRFTIQGANQFLAGKKKHPSTDQTQQLIVEVRTELEEILKMLS